MIKNHTFVIMLGRTFIDNPVIQQNLNPQSSEPNRFFLPFSLSLFILAAEVIVSNPPLMCLPSVLAD
jgi:hypothetical protein